MGAVIEGSHSGEGLARKSAAGALWLTVESWGGQILGLGVFLILAALLTPTAFGIFAVAGAFLTVLELLVDLALPSAIVQRKGLEEAHLNAAYWLALVTGILLALLTLLTSSLFAELMDEVAVGSVLSVMALQLLLRPLFVVQESLLVRNFQFRPLTMIRLSARIGGGLLGISLAVSGAGEWSLVAQLLLTSSIEVALHWSRRTWRPKLSFSVPHAVELLRFSLNLVGFRISNYLGSQLVYLIIGYYLGTTAAGYYSLGHRIYLGLINGFVVAIRRVSLPLFSQLQEDRKRVRAVFLRACRMAATGSVPLFAGTALVAERVIPLFFGPEWVGAVPCVQLFMVLGLLLAMLPINTTLFASLGRPDLALKLSSLRAVLIVVGAVAVAEMGLSAVVAASVAAAYLTAPLYLLAIRSVLDLSLRRFARNQLAPILAAMLMTAAVLVVTSWMGTGGDPKWILAAQIGTGALVYPIGLVVSVILGLAGRDLLFEPFELLRTLRKEP